MLRSPCRHSSTISALNSGVKDRRGRGGFFRSMVSILDILSGAVPLMVDVRQSGGSPTHHLTAQGRPHPLPLLAHPAGICSHDRAVSRSAPITAPAPLPSSGCKGRRFKQPGHQRKELLPYHALEMELIHSRHGAPRVGGATQEPLGPVVLPELRGTSGGFRRLRYQRTSVPDGKSATRPTSS